MNGDTETIKIGLGWYRRQDWDQLIRLFPDRARMQATYDEWRADIRRLEKRLTREGRIVERVIVDPTALTAWCALRGLQPIGPVRANYVCEQLRLHDQPLPASEP